MSNALTLQHLLAMLGLLGMNWLRGGLGVLMFLAVLASAWAHEGEHHGSSDKRGSDKRAKDKQDSASGALAPARAMAFKEIGRHYVAKVKPIFEKKCADCHSDRTVYPWYHRILGIRQLLDRDIQEGREHLDFTRDYPFRSHATPEEDLEAIRDAAREDSMPPLLYRLGHPGSGFTESEKQVVRAWAEDGLAELERADHQVQ